MTAIKITVNGKLAWSTLKSLQIFGIYGQISQNFCNKTPYCKINAMYAIINFFCQKGSHILSVVADVST